MDNNFAILTTSLPIWNFEQDLIPT